MGRVVESGSVERVERKDGTAADAGKRKRAAAARTAGAKEGPIRGSAFLISILVE